jgi:hypothetical protein
MSSEIKELVKIFKIFAPENQISGDIDPKV